MTESTDLTSLLSSLIEVAAIKDCVMEAPADELISIKRRPLESRAS